MESSVVIDQTRRSNTSTGSRSFDYKRNSRSLYFPSASPSSLFTALQQDQIVLPLNNRAGSVAGGGGGFSFLGTRPPPAFTSSRPPVRPPTTHFSLPRYHLQHQSSRPPLLPLPFSRSVSASLPPPPPNPRKCYGSKQRKPNKPTSSNQRKEKAKPKRELAKSPVAEGEEEEVEMEGDEKVYSMSPPPSSLPLPTFSLKSRSPPTAGSYNAEALGGVGEKGEAEGSAGAGTATDDLRRLLRL